MTWIRLCHPILDIPCNGEEDILNIEVRFGTLHATLRQTSSKLHNACKENIKNIRVEPMHKFVSWQHQDQTYGKRVPKHQEQNMS
jgi:hypothetical protein